MTVFNCQTCQFLVPHSNGISSSCTFNFVRIAKIAGSYTKNCENYKCTYTCKDCAHYSKPSTFCAISAPSYINGHLMNICESFKKTHKKKSSLNKAKLKYCANCKFYHIYSSICVCTQSEHYRCKVTSGRCKCNTHEFKTSKSRTLVRLPARQLIVL